MNHYREPLPEATLRVIEEAQALIRQLTFFPLHERVSAYNRLSRELGDLVQDIAPDPVVSIQLIHVDDLVPNNYNPNRVASNELELLEDSINADGLTMPVVAAPDTSEAEGEPAGRNSVVDGFHRRLVLTEKQKREYVPCSIIRKPKGDRMASTVRHNRARGKHQVDLMGELVKALMNEGWEDGKIATHLGMSEEELLRLKQIVGAAKLLAAERYSTAYGRDDEPDPVD